MADSDSSEMSDRALQSLVDRLAAVGGESDAEKDIQSSTQDCQDAISVHSAASAESAADQTVESIDELLNRAEGKRPNWTLIPLASLHGSTNGLESPPINPQPSSISTPSRGESGSLDGLEAVLASMSPDKSGTSCIERTKRDTVRDVMVVDSDGYEGDIGDVANRSTDARLLPRVPVLVTDVSSKDGAEEADDEGTSKFSKISKTPTYPKQMASLEQTLAGGSTSGLGTIFGRSGGDDAIANRWESINETLKEQGFPTISLSMPGGGVVVPQLSSVADRLRDVLYQHERRGQFIQEMAVDLNKRSQVAGHRVTRDQSHTDSLRRQVSELSKRSMEAQRMVTELKIENNALKEKLTKEKRRFNTEISNLSHQLKQSEHRVKAKEAMVQGLVEKLQSEVDKEKSGLIKEKEALKKIQHKEGWGGSANDSRVMEVVGMYSKTKDRMESELDSLRAEVACLGDELREKENTILRHRLGPDWHPSPGDKESEAPTLAVLPGDIRDRLAEGERSLRIMRQRETRAQERCAKMQQDANDSNQRVLEVQETLVNLELELKSRPSLRNWRSCQKRIQDLETQLSQAKTQAREAANVKELRRWVDTRELMRQDRVNYKLKLDKLDDLPTAVMKQILQEACRSLSLSDASLLGPSVVKLVKVVKVLPRLERFVNRVCTFVFKHSPQIQRVKYGGVEPSLEDLNGMGKAMEDVMPLLKQWLECAQEPVLLKNFHTSVVRTLEARPGYSVPHCSEDEVGTAPHFVKDRDALNALKELVELEQRVLRDKHLVHQADQSIKDDPDLLINRVVHHVQHMFDVKSVVGCIPKINEVHRFLSEVQTLLRAVRDLLGLPVTTSSEVVMTQLVTLLQEQPGVDPATRLPSSYKGWNDLNEAEPFA